MFKRMRHRIRPGISIVLCTMFTAVTLFAVPVQAEAKYKFTDVKTAYNLPGTYNNKIIGDFIASLEKDSKGAYQLYLHNWKTKTTTQVTSTNTFKTNLVVQGNNIYYYESTIEVTKHISIYPKKLMQYNMTTKKTTELRLDTNTPEILAVLQKSWTLGLSGS